MCGDTIAEFEGGHIECDVVEVVLALVLDAIADHVEPTLPDAARFAGYCYSCSCCEAAPDAFGDTGVLIGIQ